jgi:hypothetical protein
VVRRVVARERLRRGGCRVGYPGVVEVVRAADIPDVKAKPRLSFMSDAAASISMIHRSVEPPPPSPPVLFPPPVAGGEGVGAETTTFTRLDRSGPQSTSYEKLPVTIAVCVSSHSAPKSRSMMSHSRHRHWLCSLPEVPLPKTLRSSDRAQR